MDDDPLWLACLLRNLRGARVRRRCTLALVRDGLAGRKSPCKPTRVTDHPPRVGKSNRPPAESCHAGSLDEDAKQCVRVGLDPGLRFSRVRVLRLLQLVLFLRSESARAGPYARRGVDFSALPGNGGVIPSRRMVFRSRCPALRPTKRTPGSGMAWHGSRGAVAVHG